MHTSVLFESLWDKARYVDGAAQEDATDPAIAALGAEVRHLPELERAQAIYNAVRAWVLWVEDAGGVEELAGAAVVLGRRWDDCDGLARLFVALCLAAGLTARVRAVFSPDGAELQHFQAEVHLPGHPLADADGWVLAELTLEGVQFGEGAEAGAIDDTGEYITIVPMWARPLLARAPRR